MAEPLKAVLGEECKHPWDACLVEHSLVRYTILPRDTQNSLEVARVKGVEPVFLAVESVSIDNEYEYENESISYSYSLSSL